MSTILKSSALRSVAKASSSAIAPKNTRAFHSPYAVLGTSPLTSSSSTSSTSYQAAVDHYAKSYEHPVESSMSSRGLYRTYVVSEPDDSSRHYQVPAGAYPTSAPYMNFASTSAPAQLLEEELSSTSADQVAHTFTTRATRQHRGGIGASSSIRFRSAPGEMGVRGGSNSGATMMDKEGTVDGPLGNRLAERNPPPDTPSVAEKFSKAGVQDAWKLRN
ncbi:hypothetical protein BJ165DRAFT_1459926 [Panaeolus papilionaceus]|nr:hypothetical protein BJ165DRAFT_1459926 [Panaeolus papilionaceus]